MRPFQKRRFTRLLSAGPMLVTRWAHSQRRLSGWENLFIVFQNIKNAC